MPSQFTSSVEELTNTLDAILDSTSTRLHWDINRTRNGYQVTMYVPGDWISPSVANLTTDDGRAFGYIQTSYRHPTLAEALAAAIDVLTDIIADVYNDHQVAA
ncbi:MAG: hypothetical protein EON54_18340 [Alcaligenaceae bacterium]|nr:MAG: hypothetical protein EON54_18340 [Alcaligenaceae bacterium]